MQISALTGESAARSGVPLRRLAPNAGLARYEGFCPALGRMRPVVAICGNCGLPLGPADAFCGNCRLPAGSQSALSPGTGPPVVPDPPASGGAAQRPGGGIGSPDGAAVGQATPNATYLGQRLLYEKVPEATFDPLTNPRYLLLLVRQALVYVVIYIVVWVLSGIFFLILYAAGLGGATFDLAWVVDILEVIAVACLFWLLPVHALLSEWKFLVDDKGAAGLVTFEHITFVLRRRQTPLDAVQVRRLRLPGGEVRDYLELRRGIFTGFISCFAHGQDLYVGWTFWLNLSPARWLLMVVARIWQTVTRRGTDLYVTLRYESAKAMREAMHSAAREGVDVAAGELAPQGRGIGASLQVAVTEIAS